MLAMVQMAFLFMFIDDEYMDANLQDADGRSQMGSGFSRHPRVKFHLSVQIPTLQCKIGPPFSEFTSEGKQWHGMGRFRLRRLWRVNCEALMIASGQNLKRLLQKRGWGRRPFPAEAVVLLPPVDWEPEQSQSNDWRNIASLLAYEVPITLGKLQMHDFEVLSAKVYICTLC
jgi:hypothetical protein